MLYRAVRLDGALCEHVRLVLQIPVIIENLKRTQEVVARIVLKRPLVFAGGNEAVFCGKSVVQLVQPLLFGGNNTVARVYGLQLNEPPCTVP